MSTAQDMLQAELAETMLVALHGLLASRAARPAGFAAPTGEPF